MSSRSLHVLRDGDHYTLIVGGVSGALPATYNLTWNELASRLREEWGVPDVWIIKARFTFDYGGTDYEFDGLRGDR